MRTARGVARRILITLASTLVLLAALEGGARLIRGKSPPADGLSWLEFSSGIGWRARPGSRSGAYASVREFDGEGFFTVDSRDVSPEGRRGKKLILLIGDSRTFGNGVPADETFGQLLERRRSEFAVVNRAFPGYSSLQGLIALEAEARRLRPDIVVFAFDFNDRRYALHPWEVDGAERFRSLARVAARDRFVGAFALVELVGGRPTLRPDRGERQALDLGTVRPRVSPADFRQNLKAAADHAAGRGISLIFLILNDNAAESRELEDGARAWQAGRRDEAEARWQTAVARDNVFSDAARMQLSMLYEGAGRSSEAAGIRISPRTFYSVTGGFPIRTGVEYRAIIREVAATAGVPIVDAGAEIDRDPSRYFDFCHFDREGHRIVADLLDKALGR